MEKLLNDDRLGGNGYEEDSELVSGNDPFAFNAEYEDSQPFAQDEDAFGDDFSSPKDLNNFLLYRKFPDLEKPYGVFETEVSTVVFRGKFGEENFLKDIYDLNEKNGTGNIKIPNTNIELINYSPCPNCKELHSFKDLTDYYSNPRPKPEYQNLKVQRRNDTSVSCENCKHYFLPLLIVSDGTPRNQSQFLCKLQTLQNVEDFYKRKFEKLVLTKNLNNKFDIEENKFIRNDTNINDLQSVPSFIVNILQYSSPALALNFINGKNLENNDPIFRKVKHFNF